jgi:hypothetical protein
VEDMDRAKKRAEDRNFIVVFCFCFVVVLGNVQKRFSSQVKRNLLLMFKGYIEGNVRGYRSEVSKERGNKRR